MHGRTRVQQAARDAVGCADSLFVKDPGVVWVQRQRWVFYRRTVKHAQIVVQNDNKYASLTPKPGFGVSLPGESQNPLPRHARPRVTLTIICYILCG